MKSTPSGLLYKVIKEGDGAMPADTSEVEVHYEGKLIDGSVFDSSYKRGETATFAVNQVIKGWSEAVKLMKVGAEYEVCLPYELAYGERGTRGIPPFSTLIFKSNSRASNSLCSSVFLLSGKLDKRFQSLVYRTAVFSITSYPITV